MNPFYESVIHQVNMILTNNYIENWTGTKNVVIPFEYYSRSFWPIKGWWRQHRSAEQNYNNLWHLDKEAHSSAPTQAQTTRLSLSDSLMSRAAPSHRSVRFGVEAGGWGRGRMDVTNVASLFFLTWTSRVFMWKEGQIHWVSPENGFSVWISQTVMAVWLEGWLILSLLITVASEEKELLTKGEKENTLCGYDICPEVLQLFSRLEG